MKLENPDVFLNGEFAEKANITEVIPLNEGAYNEREFEDKVTHRKEKRKIFDWQVQCNDKDQTIKTWSPNNTSIRKVLELADDTKQLMGKRIPIIRSFANGKWIIYVKPSLTKAEFEALNK